MRSLLVLSRFPVKSVEKSEVKIKPFRWCIGKVKHLTVRKHFD